MIPFVVHAAHQGPAVFSCQMFADDIRPVFLGNSFYGLRKQLVDIDWSGTSYRALREGRTVFECSGDLPDGWSPWLGKTHDGLSWLRETFALPILGLRRSGQYIQLRFGWEFEHAEVCPMGASISWCPAAEQRPFHWEAVQGYSFGVREMRWRTGAPRPLPSM
jgi:hypothetical protein